MAKAFNLDPVVTGAREADQVVGDLKAQNARVIYSLDYPTRSRTLPPDADEPIRDAPRAGAGTENARPAAEGWRDVRFSSGSCAAARLRAQRRRASRTACQPTPPSAR